VKSGITRNAKTFQAPSCRQKFPWKNNLSLAKVQHFCACSLILIVKTGIHLGYCFIFFASLMTVAHYSWSVMLIDVVFIVNLWKPVTTVSFLGPML